MSTSGKLRPPPEAADKLHVATQTLAKWRHLGCGPEYVRLGGRIFYEDAALETFIAQNRRRSTSEAA